MMRFVARDLTYKTESYHVNDSTTRRMRPTTCRINLLNLEIQRQVVEMTLVH